MEFTKRACRKNKEDNMKKKIRDDFFKEYINVTDMKPNGAGLFSFVRYGTVMEEDKYVSDLYLFDMEKKEIKKQLTFDGSVGMHDWLDEENIIIASARSQEDKDAQEKGVPLVVFCKLNINTGEYSELFKVYKGVYKFNCIDENRFLLLASESPVRDEWLKEAGGDWDEYLKISERESRYFVADEVPFWSNDGGYCNKERGRVYLYDSGRLTCLTDDDISVWDIKSYKDQYGLFYGVQSGGMQKTEGKVYKIDYSTMEISAIDDSGSYIYTKIQPVDSTHILLGRNDRAFHGEYQNEYIDIVDMETGKFTRNNKNADIHFYDNVLTDVTYLSGWLNKITVTDEGIVYICTRGGSSKLFFSRFGNDEMITLSPAEGKILDYFIHGDKIYMSAMRGLDGGEFYILDPATGKEERISDFNTQLQEEFEFPQVSECNFVNSDGIEIEGWVMKPADLEEGKQYPAILFIHGGPGSAYGPVAMHEMFAMCTQGWGVIFCNPRGSEGRGGDFADIRTKWGTVDYRDFMEFTDAAIERNSWIDPDRIGITGGSYGGIIINWIIGHTDRYKAAISDRSVANLFSDYGMSDIGFPCNKDTYGTTPWENPEYLWNQSALKYAPKIKTPVLFIHGVEDYRCTYDHALQLHSAITYFGGTSKVFAVKGETHELCRSGSPVNRQRRIAEMIKWFEKYL